MFWVLWCALIKTKLAIIPLPLIRENLPFLCIAFLKEMMRAAMEWRAETESKNIDFVSSPACAFQFQHLTRKYREAVSTIKSPVTREKLLAEEIENISFSTAVLKCFPFKNSCHCPCLLFFVIIKKMPRLWRDILLVGSGSLRLHLYPLFWLISPATTSISFC